MTSIPLRHRLRNRPAVFVGRRSEMSRLKKAIERAPVCLVVGPDGFGKSSLVLATLHEHFGERIDGALQVSLDADVRVDARVELVRALGEAEEWKIAWPALLADPDALVATALDLAERGRRIIVLDDLHFADAVTSRELLAQFARYARTSRLICTSTLDPQIPELTGQVVELAAMASRQLEQLARDVSPRAARPEIQRALRLAAGSPWRLQQALSGALSDASGGAVDVLAGLPAAAVDFLRVLAIFERPLSAEVIAALGALPAGELVDRLEQRGLVERASGGLRLGHLAAASLAHAGHTTSELALRVAEALGKSSDRSALLEAARLWLSAGRIDGAVELLDREGHALLESGAAPELWRLLERVNDPRLALWRLRTAVQLGERRALEMIGDVPPRGSPRDVVSWAGAMLARGAIDEALTAAERVSNETSDAQVRFEASIVAARASIARSDLVTAREHLLRAEPVDATGEALKTALLAAVAAHAGNPDLALDWAAHASERFAALPLEARLEATRLIAGALETGGRPADAAYMLSTILTELGPRVLHLVQGRLALCLSAIADTECGHLERARATLERLEPFAAGVLRPSVEFVAIDLGIAQGRLEGLGQRLDSVLTSSLARRQASHYFACARLDLQLRALSARPLIEYPALAELEPPSPAYRDLVVLRAQALALLRAEPTTAPEISTRHAEVSMLSGIVAALRELLDGDARAALDRARSVVETARELGFAIYEAEALELVLAALAVLGQREELGRGAEELAALAGRVTSARFGGEGSFWIAAARSALDRPELLERLARSIEVAPVAARRSRALLGDEVGLDALDRLIVAAVRARPGWEPPEHVLTGATAGSEVWGIDDERRVVWLSDGTLFDLSKRDVPWRFLQLLADAGGTADKESIVAGVWGGSSYHPLRHDNRLRLAARELRRAIEVDVSEPRRVLTTDDGYALGGRVRRLKRPTLA